MDLVGYRRYRGAVLGSIRVTMDGDIVYADEVNLGRADGRARFSSDLQGRLNGQLGDLNIELRLLELLGQAEQQLEADPAPERPAAADGEEWLGEYALGPDGFVWVKTVMTPFGPIDERVRLSNFTCRIDEDVLLDDDAGEPTREFVIRGQLNGRPLPKIRLPASAVPSLAWTTEYWGVEAQVWPGPSVRDRLRHCIQTFSAGAARRVIYAHTGFRIVEGRRVFRHAGGALGADGPVDGIEVELPEKLRRYRLALPPADPAGPLRAVLEALDVADRRVTLPLLAAMVAAPLDSAIGPLASLILLGLTGLRKSTLIALYLHLYGGPFDAKFPVTTWIDTPNALEKLGHQAKDLPQWVDDIRPSTTRREREQQAAAVQRMLRGAVTRSGRGRLRRGLGNEPVYTQRGPVVTSAEQLPDTSSTLARTLVLKMSTVDLKRLSEAQATAAELFPQAGAAWVRFLVREVESLAARLAEAAKRRRDLLQAKYAGLHGGVADSAGRLEAAGTAFLAYCASVGAIDPERAEQLADELRAALEQAALDTAEFIQRARPSVEFLAALRAMLRSRRVYLRRYAGGRSLEGPPPGYEERCGWREVRDDDGEADRAWLPTAGAAPVGWVDRDENVAYLLPTEAIREVAEYTRSLRAGDIPNPEAIYRELAGRGLLARSAKDRHTLTIRIDGAVVRVLALRLEGLLSDDGGEEPTS